MNLYDFTVKDAKGQPAQLSDFNGKVVLVVNTATGCGFTPQYKGLQELYEKYKEQGFEILDFPCNQFANQAPGSNEEITSFCTLNYGTTFPRFAKIEVNGKNESPLYAWLKSQKSGVVGSGIKWNFTKFLIDQKGQVAARFAPATPPQNLERRIVDLLSADKK